MMFNESMRDYFRDRRGISVRIGLRPEELFPSEDYILLWRGYYERARREGPYTTEYPVFAGTNILQLTFHLLKRDGRTYGISVFGRDITERRKAEEDLRQSLAEKETLLRELYHRTKNNMNTIIAMLNLQARSAGDARLTEAFADAQNRILSMSLVHERLYKSKDLSRVDLKDYINDLISLLADTYSVPHDRLSIVSELEPVSVMIDSAIPCGMVLNELISNSMKHAFPGERGGVIRVGLTGQTDGLIRLEVADTGVGVPPGFDFRRDGRLGSRTVFSLIESQLGGRVSLDTREGVSWRFEFRDDQYSPSV
jgi:two-component sensor histidine kinase